MKLRPATEADVPAMVEVGRRAHAEGRLAQFEYDEEKLREGLASLIRRQATHGSHLCVLVENREGELIGGIIGAIEEYFFTRRRSANSILLWVDPAYRGGAAALRLIHALRDWGRKSGAAEVCISVATGVRIARTDRFLRRIGFAQTGGNYAMPL